MNHSDSLNCHKKCCKNKSSHVGALTYNRIDYNHKSGRGLPVVEFHWEKKVGHNKNNIKMALSFFTLPCLERQGHRERMMTDKIIELEGVSQVFKSWLLVYQCRNSNPP